MFKVTYIYALNNAGWCIGLVKFCEKHVWTNNVVILPCCSSGDVLDLIWSSQNEFVDNVKVHVPLGSSDHNQIHFNIKAKASNTYKKQWRRNFNKGKYKKMRTYLAYRLE